MLNTNDNTQLSASNEQFLASEERKAQAYLASQLATVDAFDAETVRPTGLLLKCASEIVDKRQEWLIPTFLPDDTLVVLAGQPGLGKTTACLSWAASLTNGRRPIADSACNPRNVLMLSNEDSEAQLRRIFERLGGNLNRLFVEDEESEYPWGLGDIYSLEKRVEELNPALVIIDSLSTHKPGKCDLNSHGDVAPVLVALRKLAAKHNCCIAVIHHTNKTQTTDPLSKISGSGGISATARHVILVAQHPEDDTARVAAIAKTNLCAMDSPAYQFRLDPFAWIGQTQLSASDLLADGKSDESQSDAESFLADALADGRRDSVELAKQAEAAGINRRSLQRVARKLGIVKSASGRREDRKIYWSIPSDTQSTTIDDNQRHIYKSVVDCKELNLNPLDAIVPIDDKNTDVSSIVSSIDGQPFFEEVV